MWPRIPSPCRLGLTLIPPTARLLLQLPLPHPVPPPLESLAVLWSGATPPLTQGGGPPREGWAIPESLWWAALCPCVLMVQSPLSKATWELHSAACWTRSGPTDVPSMPTSRSVVLWWSPGGWVSTLRQTKKSHQLLWVFSLEGLYVLTTRNQRKGNKCCVITESCAAWA